MLEYLGINLIACKNAMHKAKGPAYWFCGKLGYYKYQCYNIKKKHAKCKNYLKQKQVFFYILGVCMWEF